MQENDHRMGWTRDEASPLNVGDVGTVNLFGGEFDFEINQDELNEASKLTLYVIYNSLCPYWSLGVYNVEPKYTK